MAQGAGFITAWQKICSYLSEEDVAELDGLEEADLVGALMTRMVSDEANPLEPEDAEELLILAHVLDEPEEEESE